MDTLSKDQSVLLEASGLAVGLPDGLMGNSEVGHYTIGTGRVSYQVCALCMCVCAFVSYFLPYVCVYVRCVSVRVCMCVVYVYVCVCVCVCAFVSYSLPAGHCVHQPSTGGENPGEQAEPGRCLSSCQAGQWEAASPGLGMPCRVTAELCGVCQCVAWCVE